MTPVIHLPTEWNSYVPGLSVGEGVTGKTSDKAQAAMGGYNSHNKDTR